MPAQYLTSSPSMSRQGNRLALPRRPQEEVKSLHGAHQAMPQSSKGTASRKRKLEDISGGAGDPTEVRDKMFRPSDFDDGVWSKQRQQKQHDKVLCFLGIYANPDPAPTERLQVSEASSFTCLAVPPPSQESVAENSLSGYLCATSHIDT